MRLNKKVLFVTTLCAGLMVAQSFAQHHDDDDQPKNLQVLPKNISGKELHDVMKEYSMSLGVHCNFCHVSEQVEGQPRPKMDFASDTKPEKLIARSMMKMTAAINDNYIGKMNGGDHSLERITCVTCHMGRKTPVVSLDSLKAMGMMNTPPPPGGNH